MGAVIKLEELAMLLAAIFLFSLTHFAWWWFPVLLLTPDLSAMGYLVNSRTGSCTYNFFHHKAVALLVLGAGYWLPVDWLYLAGIILFAHASMDRLFRYGLKYPHSADHTHLGLIGKARRAAQ